MTYLCRHHGPVEAEFRKDMAFCPHCLEQVWDRVVERVCSDPTLSPFERLMRLVKIEPSEELKVGGA